MQRKAHQQKALERLDRYINVFDDANRPPQTGGKEGDFLRIFRDGGGCFSFFPERDDSSANEKLSEQRPGRGHYGDQIQRWNRGNGRGPGRRLIKPLNAAFDNNSTETLKWQKPSAWKSTEIT